MESDEGLIISSSGVVSFSSPPDFESDWLRSGVVSITDGVFVSNRNINVILNNLNDNAPTFDSETATFTKDERHWNSACVLTCPEVRTVTATDADYDSGFNYGEGFEFSYSIISQNPANAFTINSATGAITSLDPHLDYETDSSYELTVQASDGEFSDTLDVTVNVRNINEDPYISSSQNLSINENETVVATITADDYEGYSNNNPISIHIMTHGGSPTGECQSGLEPDCEFFSIETLSENTARLSMTAPDYEDPQDSNEDNVYQLSIGLSMGNTNCGFHYPSCGSDFDFTVTVNDVNEPPYLNAYSWEGGSCTFTGSEPNITAAICNSPELSTRFGGSSWPLGFSFGVLYFNDPEGDSLTYSISGDDASYIRIHESLGYLYWTEAPDYETRTSYSIIVTVSDGTSQTQIDLTINVTDVNENP